MSCNIYQTFFVQRSVLNHARGAVSAKGRKRKPSTVHVPLSKETAETLQKVSEETRLPREILAAEAIRRGMAVLAIR
jgi:hypothetical protein